jgi:hypothetical protein
MVGGGSQLHHVPDVALLRPSKRPGAPYTWSCAVRLSPIGDIRDFEHEATRSPRAALRHQPADRHQHRGVLFRPHAGNIRQGRRWLVLVVSPAPLFARRSGDWSVCYELFSVSARDGYGAGLFLTTCLINSAHCPANTRQGELQVIEDHTRHFWNLSGTFGGDGIEPIQLSYRKPHDFSILCGTVGSARTTGLLFRRQAPPPVPAAQPGT